MSLLTVKETVAICFGFSEASLRDKIVRAKRNPKDTFNAVVKREGRSVFIDSDALNFWLSQQKTKQCGTRSMYASGCRCEECTKANREYLKKWRKAKR